MFACKQLSKEPGRRTSWDVSFGSQHHVPLIVKLLFFLPSSRQSQRDTHSDTLAMHQLWMCKERWPALGKKAQCDHEHRQLQFNICIYDLCIAISYVHAPNNVKRQANYEKRYLCSIERLPHWVLPVSLVKTAGSTKDFVVYKIYQYSSSIWNMMNVKTIENYVYN